MALESGTQLGHYQITEQIGKGGMGEVYRARDTKLGREVAIKVLPSEFSRDAERLARLEREARMLAALNHPNIAAIHGLEESDITRFLVLELVEGDTLADRLQRGAIPVDTSLKLALQIAEALEAAHEKGVIHRDLKPANIKVTPDGRVKVLDFGLAKAFMGDQADTNLSHSPTLSIAATQAGLILGTAAYMSPEQASGEVADHRSDVWSFGVVLFEMLSGRQLFTGKTASHVMGAVLERTPDWNQLPPNLHPRVRLLLERCLEKETRRRCQGITEARSEIEKALTRPGDLLPPAVPSSSEQPQSSGLRWMAALAAAAAVGGVLVWAFTPSPAGAPGIVTRFDEVLPAGSGFRRQGRDTVAISPDSRDFVYNTDAGLVLRSMNERDPRIIPGTEGDLTNPFFSSDSQWIGYWDSASSQLQKIPVGGGSSITLTAAENPFGASWGRDGMILFGQPEGIMRVSDDGGEPELVVPAGEEGEELWDPQLLPDGRVLFTAWEGASGEITVASPGDDDRAGLFPGERAVYLPTGHLIVTDPAASPSALLARSFDLSTLEFGGAVPMTEGVALTNGRTHFAVSESGSLVHVVGFSAGGGLQDRILAIVDREGRIGEEIDVDPAPYLSPRISPNGQFLAVQINGSDGTTDIWIKSLVDDSRIRRLTLDGRSSRPVWTPDSARVTYASIRDGVPGIFWQSIAGGAAERLTETEGQGQHWPESWSPDGQTLGFTDVPPSGDLTGQAVWAYSRDDDTMMALPVLTGIGSGGLTFSPDGDWFAYHVSRGGEAVPTQIYVQPYPATGADIPVTPEGGSYAVFSSEGRLTYRRPAPTQAVVNAANSSATEVVLIDLQLGGGVTFGEEQILNFPGLGSVFGFRDFDPTPDGQGLVVALFPEQLEAVSPEPQINVVLNWIEELKERVPVN